MENHETCELIGDHDEKGNKDTENLTNLPDFTSEVQPCLVARIGERKFEEAIFETADDVTVLDCLDKQSNVENLTEIGNEFAVEVEKNQNDEVVIHESELKLHRTVSLEPENMRSNFEATEKAEVNGAILEEIASNLSIPAEENLEIESNQESEAANKELVIIPIETSKIESEPIAAEPIEKLSGEVSEAVPVGLESAIVTPEYLAPLDMKHNYEESSVEKMCLNKDEEISCNFKSECVDPEPIDEFRCGIDSSATTESPVLSEESQGNLQVSDDEAATLKLHEAMLEVDKLRVDYPDLNSSVEVKEIAAKATLSETELLAFAPVEPAIHKNEAIEDRESVPVCGPGFKSPADATKGNREKIVYTAITYCGDDPSQSDGIATIDVDEQSPTYSQVIHILKLPYVGDEGEYDGGVKCAQLRNLNSVFFN
jgi:hypothetical protein